MVCGTLHSRRSMNFSVKQFDSYAFQHFCYLPKIQELDTVSPSHTEDKLALGEQHRGNHCLVFLGNKVCRRGVICKSHALFTPEGESVFGSCGSQSLCSKIQMVENTHNVQPGNSHAKN